MKKLIFALWSCGAVVAFGEEAAVTEPVKVEDKAAEKAVDKAAEKALKKDRSDARKLKMSLEDFQKLSPEEAGRGSGEETCARGRRTGSEEEVGAEAKFRQGMANAPKRKR